MAFVDESTAAQIMALHGLGSGALDELTKAESIEALKQKFMQDSDPANTYDQEPGNLWVTSANAVNERNVTDDGWDLIS